MNSRTDRKPSIAFVHTLLSLMICLSVACGTRQEGGATCPVIEMSAVADSPGDSTRAVTVNDTGTILISRAPLVTSGDVTGATASQSGDQWAVNFTVTDDAARRVHEFTNAHVGGRLALVVDGKVHGTPRIAAAVAGNGYRIDGFSRADAEQLAKGVSNGCRH